MNFTRIAPPRLKSESRFFTVIWPRSAGISNRQPSEKEKRRNFLRTLSMSVVLALQKFLSRNGTFLHWWRFWSGIYLFIVTCGNNWTNRSPNLRNRNLFSRNSLLRIAVFNGRLFLKNLENRISWASIITQLRCFENGQDRCGIIIWLSLFDFI